MTNTSPYTDDFNDYADGFCADGFCADGFCADGFSDDGFSDDDWLDDPPPAPLGLDRVREASLVEAILARLRDHGCDTTLHAARAWAQREKVPWPPLRGALEGRGGFCDCEVLLNALEPPG